MATRDKSRRGKGTRTKAGKVLRVSLPPVATSALQATLCVSLPNSHSQWLPTTFAGARTDAVGWVHPGNSGKPAVTRMPPPLKPLAKMAYERMMSTDGRGVVALYCDGSGPSPECQASGAGLWDATLCQGWAWVGPAPHTNNRAELYALYLALLRAQQLLAESTMVVVEIRTDSQYSINCVTQWLPGWIMRGWRKADNNPVLNRDLLEPLHALYEDVKGPRLHILYVKGHSADHGNACADRLAAFGSGC